LSILKENFTYQAYFNRLRTDPYRWCAPVPRPGESAVEHAKRYTHQSTDPEGGSLDQILRDYGLNGSAVTTPSRFFTFNEIVKYLDPHGENPFTPNREEMALFTLFRDPAVSAVTRLEGRHPEYIPPGFPYTIAPSLDLHAAYAPPNKALLEIDLSRDRWEILAELTAFIDHAQAQLGIKDSRRWRKETERHMLVWGLRKKRKAFSEIGKQLNLSQDTVENSFYRAYELTQGRKYDRQEFYREFWEQQKADLNKKCSNCPNRVECERTGTLCPEIMAYVDQDYVPLREKILRNDDEALKDHLFLKA